MPIKKEIIKDGKDNLDDANIEKFFSNIPLGIKKTAGICDLNCDKEVHKLCLDICDKNVCLKSDIDEIEAYSRQCKKECEKNCDEEIKIHCQANSNMEICLAEAVISFEEDIKENAKKTLIEFLVSLPLPHFFPKRRELVLQQLPIIRVYYKKDWQIIYRLLCQRAGTD